MADKNDELIEVCTEDGTPTGVAKTRKEIHDVGDWHRIGDPPKLFPPPSMINLLQAIWNWVSFGTVHVWCVNPHTGEMIVQKRAPDKLTNPNCWDISCAGHIEAGETSIQAGNSIFCSEVQRTTSHLWTSFISNQRIKRRDRHWRLARAAHISWQLSFSSSLSKW